MAPPPQGLDRLRGVARRLLWGALACLVLPALAWLGTALYGELAGPVDGPPAVLSAVLVLYMAPVGAVLLVLGLVAAGWAWWLGR